MPTPTSDLDEALRIDDGGDGRLRATVHDGWDVYGIPHGGYLAALAANAVLTAAGAPDVFTATTHFIRKARMGPMELHVVRVAGSRRFTTWSLQAVQEGDVVLAGMASVGDRESIQGPSWTSTPHTTPAESELTAVAGADGQPFPTPAVAQRMGMRLTHASTSFVQGRRGDVARMRARTAAPGAHAQLAAIIACDLTPPAVWNALGMEGWVPTVELTAHVRARPVDGPLTVDAVTNHVIDGFLDEDCLVHDAAGRLIVQSRQLARWTAPAG